MNLDHDQLQDTLRQVALPALAGAAGTGALGAYVSSQGNVQGESPVQRRHRILRNALISAGLGGMAGATLPIGLKTLSEPYMGSGGSGMFDRATDAGLGHAGAVAGGGGMAYWNHLRGNKWRDEAQKHVLSQIRDPGMKLDPAAAEASGLSEVKNIPNLRQVMGSGDEGTKALLSALAGRGGGEPSHNLFRAAEILRDAGHDPIYASDLQRMFKVPQDTTSMFANKPGTIPPIQLPENLVGEYSKYLSNEGSLQRPFTKAVGMATEGASKIPGIGRFLSPGANRLAQFYSQAFRPGAGRLLGRSIAPLGIAGILGGALLGNRLQNKLTGD